MPRRSILTAAERTGLLATLEVDHCFLNARLSSDRSLCDFQPYVNFATEPSAAGLPIILTELTNIDFDVRPREAPEVTPAMLKKRQESRVAHVASVWVGSKKGMALGIAP